MTILREVWTANDAEVVDILTIGGRIAAIMTPGTADAGGHAVVEGNGRLAVPGFIDAHVHAEGAVFRQDVQLAMLRQGITTVVTGQDGVSYAPGGPASHEWASGYFAAINGGHPTFAGGSVADLLAHYDAATPLNVAYLVPHGTLRHAVMGTDPAPASPEQLARMVSLLTGSLDDGACGLSTGLEYLPSGYAQEAELVELCSVLARRGRVHVSHMRGYQDRAAAALAELGRVAIASGVATHISHLHGPAAELLPGLDAMATSALDVTFDSYPYLRGCTILSMLLLPTWLPLAEPRQAARLLSDPTVRHRLLTEHLPQLADTFPRIRLAAVPGELAWAEGLTLPELAQQLELSPAEASLEVLTASGLRASAVFAQPPTSNAHDMHVLLRDHRHLAGSDAIYAGSRPHPRGWGAFARLLGHHVRERGDWTWPQAITHLSTRAADRFGLTGRGRLEVGAVADVALVDTTTVGDQATYDEPRRLARGIDDVLVAGTPVLAGGRLTGALPGRGLRTKEQ